MIAEPDRAPLVYSEMDFLNQMEMNYEAICQNLGGKPFGIVCPKGRRLRYKRMAEYLNLQLFESDTVKREDGFVLIHAGELGKWVNLVAP